MTVKVRVEKAYGVPELEEKLQELRDRGIKPEEVMADGKHYTIVYEDSNILNEG